MNRTSTFSLSWTLPLAFFAAIALSTGTSPALGQTIASPAAENSTPTIMLSGPKGDPLTLIHSPDGGWQLQAGWPSQQQEYFARSADAVFSEVDSSQTDAQQVVERPLTVFVDGPTGYTFIYLQDEGWKFVGQVARRNH
jgi:hypothetical protein